MHDHLPFNNEMKTILIKLVILCLFINSCTSSAQNCTDLPEQFSTYTSAKKLVKSSSFRFDEYINTITSSWIRGATFYSCDSKTGFLIIKTDKKEYIHQGVPIDLWNGFKKSESYGSYYNRYIKGKYQLKLEI